MAAYGFDRDKTYPATQLPGEIRDAIIKSHRESEEPYDLPRWYLMFINEETTSKEAWDYFWDNDIWKLAFTDFRYINQAFYVISRPNDGKAPAEFCRVKKAGSGYIVDWCEYDGIDVADGETSVDFDKATPEMVVVFGEENFPDD